MQDACASGCRVGLGLRLPLFCDGTDREPVGAIADEPFDIAGIEVDAAGFVRGGQTE